MSTWIRTKEFAQNFQWAIGLVLYLAAGIGTGLGYGKVVAQEAGRQAATQYVQENQQAIVDQLVGLNATVRALVNGQAMQTCRAIGPQQIPGPDPSDWAGLSDAAKVQWCEKEKRYREALWAREDECARNGVPREKCVMPRPEEVP